MDHWEREREPEPRFALFFQRMPVDDWTNLNGFVAALTVASVRNFESYSTRILRYTLEEPRRADGIDDNLGGAAVWTLHGGALIWQMRRD